MRFLILLLLSLPAFIITPSTYAAKPRIRTSVARRSGGVATGYSKARLSRNTNSVIVTFLNSNSVANVTYTLSYTANGIEQGAVGSLIPSGATGETRDLYFGTCSHGVCTPHRGIQKAVLLVETHLSSGRTNTKRYRIKY